MKNKIKGSSEAFSPKKLFMINTVAAVICTVLRIYHSLKLIEPDTGFYSKKDFTVYLFFIVLAGTCVFTVIASFFSKDTLDVSPKNINRSKLPGIVSLLFSFAFISDFAGAALKQYDNGLQYYSDENPFTLMMRSGMLPSKAIMIFAALSCIFFLIFAILVLTGKYRGQLKVISLATVFWGVSKLVSLFVKQISFVQVSDLLLEIVSTAFLTIFLFSLCECLSGIYRKDALWRICGIGLPAMLCCLSTQLPRLIRSTTEYPLSLAELVAGIFIATLFITVLSREQAETAE